MNDNPKNNILVLENIRQKRLTILEYFNAYICHQIMMTNINIPELLVFIIWHFPTLRCYIFNYHSYYICTNDQDNVAYWEESEWIEVLANNFGLSQIQLRILVLLTTPGKVCNFSPLLNLERAFPALKLTENCYLNMNISFSWKMAISW